MSTLYLGTDSESLAERLAGLLDERTNDFFAPTTVVVPNRYVAKWLRLGLARKLGVAINLRFLYLENALWDMLRQVDPRAHAAVPELLDHEDYRLLVLSVLWENNPELAPFHLYVGEGDDRGRNYWRRCWHLADRLARFIRDYEYHRQDALIQHWLRHELGYADADADTVRLERGQRAVFESITRLPDGKRALLEQVTGKVLKTLPQYAMEVMELTEQTSRDREGAAGRFLTGAARGASRVHLFGITQISALHVKTLHWLGRYFDLRLYHLNPLAGRTTTTSKETLQELTQGYREPASGTAAQGPGLDLFRSWGQAGAESLWLLAELLEQPASFTAELVSRPSKTQGVPPKADTVLARLHAHLCGAPATAERRPQDTSVQIVACPGVYREVETVYNSILDNLQRDPTLRQTDIAVLATDLARYRPVLQAVFERQPRLLQYNLANFSAAGLSSFGQALLGFLDLALESLSRSEVFAVLLNPCVLARLGVDRTQALTWLAWAEQLGIYHAWDRGDKQERGYQPSPLYSWRLGLQRLRLGRIMDVVPERSDVPAPRFRDVIPYADLASGDKEQLDAFCRAVEGLLPCLVRLRGFQGTGTQWAGEVRKLVDHFLAVPEDRPEEAQVRDRLLESLTQLDRLDQVQAATQAPARLSLALVRELVHDHLEALEGAKGEVLTGGVTISALASLRPVPFRILYVLGLGEDLFPGPNALSTFDLRAHERLPGDIRPAENNRFLFLDALLSARDKLYLLYNNRELQRDQELHPCVPLTQLRHYLEEHVIGTKFAVIAVPLSRSDTRYLQANPPHTDVMVNYYASDRLLALSQAQDGGALKLDSRNEREFQRRMAEAERTFELTAGGDKQARSSSLGADGAVITTRELQRFLLCPAEAALKRHLHVQDDEDDDLADEEPFWTGTLQEHNLMVRSLERFVTCAVQGSVAEAEAEWRQRFAGLYDEFRLRCKVPEGAFAELDRAELEHKLEERLTGEGGLAGFLQERSPDNFVGPILIGESLTPVHPQIRFPAVRIEVGQNLFVPAAARLVGSWNLAWRSPKALELLVLTNRAATRVPEEDLSKPLLEPLLFFLALRAGAERQGQAPSSAEWLHGLPVHIHVSHAGGIARFSYAAGDIKPRQAQDYLARLAVDFLNATCYDLLPFELIVRTDLKKAYTASDEEAASLARQYAKTLEDLDEQDQESDHPLYRRSALMNVVDARVPGDAFDKVRRRFRPLDIGPARNRTKPKEKRGKSRSGQARCR